MDSGVSSIQLLAELVKERPPDSSLPLAICSLHVHRCGRICTACCASRRWGWTFARGPASSPPSSTAPSSTGTITISYKSFAYMWHLDHASFIMDPASLGPQSLPSPCVPQVPAVAQERAVQGRHNHTPHPLPSTPIIHTFACSSSCPPLLSLLLTSPLSRPALLFPLFL